MIDIHSHILPSVDDGSKDMEMSIEMARMYLENRIGKVIATPHYIEGIDNNSREDNRARLEELKLELKKQQIDLEVLLGNEVLVSLEMLEKLDRGEISTLNGSRYVLIEFPMFDIPMYTEDIIYELLIKGYVPIIAHPERNLRIMEDPNILYNYIKNGALAQLNLPSLEGKYGNKIKETAKILLRHNMIHFVATDSHSNRNRSPNVDRSLDILRSIVSRAEFRNLTLRNPQSIVEDNVIDIEGPEEYIKSKSIFGFFINRIGVF